MKKLIIKFCILLVALLCLVSCCYANDTEKQNIYNNLTARKAILVDAASGNILFEKDAYSPWHPASTTKLMAALLILENGNLNDTTVISSSATDLIGGYRSVLLYPGQKYTINQLLNLLLIESDNASCNALAEYLAGNKINFVKKMNERAKELGLSAHFQSAYGFTDDDHYMSAHDLYVIAKTAMSYHSFREIVRKPSYHMITNDVDFTVRNRNNFIGRDSRVLGVKTGYTSAAQCNLVTYAEDNGHALYAVVMGSPRGEIDYSYPDTKMLLDYGFKLLDKLL